MLRKLVNKTFAYACVLKCDAKVPVMYGIYHRLTPYLPQFKSLAGANH